MTTLQWVQIGAGALLVGLFVRNKWRQRMIKQYTARELKDRLGRDGNIVLLDVRTSAEHRSSNIKGSLHLPLHELGRRIGELKRYREKEIVCYCQSGSRSLSAAALLAKDGFDVANLRGGIAEWNFHQL